jgi:hypothetical protein
MAVFAEGQAKIKTNEEGSLTYKTNKIDKASRIKIVLYYDAGIEITGVEVNKQLWDKPEKVEISTGMGRVMVEMEASGEKEINGMELFKLKIKGKHKSTVRFEEVVQAEVVTNGEIMRVQIVPFKLAVE